MYELAICVVLYRRHPLDSETVVSLISNVRSVEALGSVHLRIVDNTEGGYVASIPTALSNHEKLDVTLHKTFNNISLAKIYNEFHSEIRAKYYVFFDQDSVVSAEYFSAFAEVRLASYGVLVPKLIDEKRPGRLYSPRRQPLIADIFNRSTIRHFPDSAFGEVESKGIFAVMSGVIVASNIFSLGVSFDENLSFYGVDSKFFYDYEALSSPVYILPTYIKHELSSLKIEPIEVKRWRFLQREYAKRELEFYSELSSIRCFSMGLTKAVLLSLGSLDIGFLSGYLKLYLRGTKRGS